jgi:hypothetical protein
MIVSDIIIAPFWLAANLLLGSTAWKWGRSLFPQEGVLSSIVHTLVLCWACVVSTAVVLGLFGVLTCPQSSSGPRREAIGGMAT